jgi:hypothetical protein
MAATALVATSASAYADTTLSATYPVNGSSYIATPGATLPLGPGKLAANVDLNTGAITATLTLPESTGSFKELGLIPVTATAQIINDGPTTGTLNLTTGAVQTTSNITLRLVSLSVAGLPIPVGPACETSAPTAVTLNSQPGFNVLKGGTVTGSYGIPAFTNCGLATLVINLTLPGQNNTITLTLGKAKIKS